MKAKNAKTKRTIVAFLAFVFFLVFLDQLFVIMHQQLCIDLTNQLEHNTDDDDETGTGNDEILARKRGVPRKGKRHDGNDTEENAAPEVQAVAHFLEHASGLATWTNARNEAAALLNVIGKVIGLECDGDVEIRERNDEEEVDRHVENARRLRIEIRVDEADDTGKTWCSLEELRDDAREGNERDCEDDRHHACLIQANRNICLHTTTGALVSVRNRNSAVSIREEDNCNEHRERNDEEEVESGELLLTRSEHRAERARHACDDAREDKQRDTVANTLLRDELTEPHDEDATDRDVEHRKEDCRERHRNDVSRSSTIEEDEETVALGKSEENAEPARIRIDRLLSLYTLFAERLKAREDDGTELENDGSVDVRGESEKRDAEILHCTSRECGKDAERAGSGTVIEELLEESPVSTGDRNVRHAAEHDEHGKREKNALAEIIRLPELPQILEHIRRR